MDDIIQVYEEHLQFLHDQYRLFEDNLTDEEKSRVDISTKLNRLKHKILEMKYLIDLEKTRIENIRKGENHEHFK